MIEHQCNMISELFKTISAEWKYPKTLTDLGKSYLQLILSSPTLDLFRIIIAETPRFQKLVIVFIWQDLKLFMKD